MKRSVTTLALSFFFAAILCFAACTRQAAPSATGASTSDDQAGSPMLRLVTSYKVDSLDPTKNSHWFTEFGAAELPLILGEDFQLKPWVLESFTQVDALNWRLTLRPNVQFQNGKQLDAAALVACMNSQLERSAATKALLPNAQVKVRGEREVMLTTALPDPNVPAALAEEGVFPIYDMEAVAKVGSNYTKLAGSGCYTGPYQVIKLDDRELALERHAGYWQGVPPLGRVSVRFVPDAQARILAVQSGEADIALYPPTEAKRLLVNESNAFFVTGVRSGGAPRVSLNNRIAPLNDCVVRQAFSFGIDREALAKGSPMKIP